MTQKLPKDFLKSMSRRFGRWRLNIATRKSHSVPAKPSVFFAAPTSKNSFWLLLRSRLAKKRRGPTKVYDHTFSGFDKRRKAFNYSSILKFF